MGDTECKSLIEVLQDLEGSAPGVPLLALGQTIFWDEPMKAGVGVMLRKIGSTRRLVAGVHDTDYFAKLPGGVHVPGKFKTLPHNDTTTRGLWSAAGEFSTLFGSETVVTRDALAAAGLRIQSVTHARPGFLDEATEAWGWRGIVSLDEHAPITADVPLDQILPELQHALNWALDSSLESLAGMGKEMATEVAKGLRELISEAAKEPGQTVSSFYQKLLPDIYAYVSNRQADIDTTATTELLRFNQETCDLPRFDLLRAFIEPKTRNTAKKAYDTAIAGSAGLYELARFGTGAIPFDLVIPGVGRGTIRLGTKGAVIMTNKPLFLSFKKPLETVKQLAEAIEKKFGSNCVLVGKAVALIGMLSREFSFLFHEGASSYVKHSRKFHQNLAAAGFPLQLNPILRVKYNAWDALSVSCSWLRLPEILQRPFGTEELCAPSFSERWKSVGEEQSAHLQQLSKLKRPVELLAYLDKSQGGAWHCLATDYSNLHGRLDRLDKDLKLIKAERDSLYTQMRKLRQDRLAAEKAKGDHFRLMMFEKDPCECEYETRKRLEREIQDVIHKQGEVLAQMREARRRQHELTRDPEVVRIHERRRQIELEAELKRARIIRSAIVASKGLASAGLRPSAWWFRLVCPDGLWFSETISTAQAYLEPLM